MTNTPTPISIPSGYTAKIEGNQIIFEPVKPKYPTWEDAECEVEKLQWFKYDEAGFEVDEVVTTLIRLKWLRDEWNKIDGFVEPKESQYRKTIQFRWQTGNFEVFNTQFKCFLYFHSDLPTAQLFLDTFREQIEIAKEYVN
jgi:hypothetical protein